MSESGRGATDGAGRSALMVVGAVVTIAFLWAVRSIVMLAAFALLLAYALDPMVGWIARLRLPRGAHPPRALAAGLVMAGLVAIAIWTAVVVTPQLVNEAMSLFTGLPAQIKSLVAQVDQAASGSPYSGAIAPMIKQLEAQLPQLQNLALRWVGQMFGNVIQLAGLAVLPVLAFYLLAERQEVRASVLRFVPSEAHRELEKIGRAVDRALASYVRGQAVVCLVSGAIMTVALAALGISHALLLGFLVGFAEILPFIGFWMAASAIVLIGLGESPMRAALGIGAYVISNNLVGLLVTPRVMGRHLKLHPFVVTVSVLAGGELLGPPGVLLALPAAAIAQAVVEVYAPRASGRDEHGRRGGEESHARR